VCTLPPLAQWQVASEPGLVIGEVEGDEALLFSCVPAATIRSDGVIVIVDGASHELRFFDVRGAFSGRIGRKGRGPGEFSSIAGMVRVAGDTLVVRDEVGAHHVDRSGSRHRALRGPDRTPRFPRRRNPR